MFHQGKKLIFVLFVTLTPCPSVPAANVITFHGYPNCIELSNSTTRVVLGPEGGRVLEYSEEDLNG